MFSDGRGGFVIAFDAGMDRHRNDCRTPEGEAARIDAAKRSATDGGWPMNGSGGTSLLGLRPIAAGHFGLVTAIVVAAVPLSVNAVSVYDSVINPTLVYGALTVMLPGTFLVIVLLLQLALSPLTASNSLAIAVSTLAVAALFRLARRGIQATVCRFFRSRYDAARTLALFGRRLRVAVDLDALGAELRAVVADTMQLAHVTLWLRAPEYTR